MKILVAMVVFWALGSSVVRAAEIKKLSAPQKLELEQRLKRFYASPTDASIMNEAIPKYSAKTGLPTHPNQALRLKGAQPGHPLLRLAQAKATPAFRKAQIWRNRAKHASIETDDQVHDLASTWVDDKDINYTLDDLPTEGETTTPLWSDDYWRTQWGGLGYRYAEGQTYLTYKAALAAYDQPDAWTQLLESSSVQDIQKKIVKWSPAEKYDLTVGDDSFGLTAEQKGEGKSSEDENGDVEDWVGICEGWSAASIMVPRPTKSFTATGFLGTKISWYPSDVRAVASLAWARGNTNVNFVSTRCNAQDPDTAPNGRLTQQECFDTNPATFHLALGNMLGNQHLAFVMDATFDYEIWNQPIKSYEMTYFNPLDPSKTSKNWKDVAVDYDERFKNRDRFQEPLTRGKRKGSDYDDSEIKKIVGVTTTVVYLTEADPPEHIPELTDEYYDMVSYQYDLELSEKDGVLVPSGGEWFQNSHPDFLWIPQNGVVATNDVDTWPGQYTGKATPTDAVTAAAVEGSTAGYPLCKVLSTLVKGSSGMDYYCPSSK